jgi:hypothetical protein
MGKTISIAVIGHLPLQKDLPEGFDFLKRRSDTTLEPTLATNHHFKAPSYVWSEYSAWFENSKIVSSAEITGLYHYRCVLNTFQIRISEVPIIFRNFFLKLQLRSLKKLKNTILVGEPNYVSQKVYGHFGEVHPESLHLLDEACDIYDDLMNFNKGSAKNRLLTSVEYFPRNIFVSDTKFGESWIVTSFEISKRLDSQFKDTPPNRWGGFVLERIFTLFVEDFSRQNRIVVKELQQTYFVENSLFLKNLFLESPIGKSLLWVKKSFS